MRSPMRCGRWARRGRGCTRAGTHPAFETRPKVGASPVTPLNAAGMRMLPPVSVPIAARNRPAATPLADPELKPPAQVSRSHGPPLRGAQRLGTDRQGPRRRRRGRHHGARRAADAHGPRRVGRSWLPRRAGGWLATVDVHVTGPIRSMVGRRSMRASSQPRSRRSPGRGHAAHTGFPSRGSRCDRCRPGPGRLAASRARAG